jgi:hypothetical protein
MALADIIGDIQGSVPNQDAAQARTVLNEAWQDVRRLGGWSWQFLETGFTVPGMLSTGTVTLTFGSPTVTGDANGIAVRFAYHTAPIPGWRGRWCRDYLRHHCD